ncbi:hypothetical protein BJF84_16070 [Rhodococcus sp. CUA-806]|nr:hypothetical protein BJF84_16070 [Rhodococcus sp. CUA-806]
MLAVLLARMSDTDDVAIGTPVAGRGSAELDDMIGMFVNTLVLRTQVDSALTFAELLAEVRESDLSAFAHSDVPFERIVDVVDPQRSRGRHPLFQVMYTFQNLEGTRLELGGLTVGGIELDAVHAKFDLQITVSDSHDSAANVSGWNVEFVYATDLFDRSTVDVLGARLLRLLTGLLDAPDRPVGDIELVEPLERARLLQTWSASSPDHPMAIATLVDRFDAVVAASPDRTAVRWDGQSWSYAEIARRVRALTHQLIAFGAGPETLVAVALPRSVELVVALLAVSTSGAGYLPIDPSYPTDRIQFMVDDAKPIVAVASGLDIDFGGVPVLDPNAIDPLGTGGSPLTDADRRAPLTPQNVAYVIYTSGSTGTPKGVAVTHENVLRLFSNTQPAFGFGADDVWTMFHSYAFDFSVWEMWGPLIHGGTLVVVDFDTSRAPEAFRDLLVDERVTVVNQTPSAFYQLAEADRVLPDAEFSLRYVIFGGEALEPRRLENWLARHGDGTEDHQRGPVLVNMYGITETTVHVSIRFMTAHDVPSASMIGVPLPGLRTYVLDRRLRPVPVGVAGEMYVGGGQVSRGYRGRPALTSTRFVADPFGQDGDVLYRTGDRARWVSAHGGAELEYLGRADDQVKLRGFRIELGEIEAAISGREDVSAVAVIVREDHATGPRLVAYLVPVDGDSLDLDDIRRSVAAQVPDYMVPSAFVPVETIPLTVNGKLDRRALPEPEAGGRVFRAPRARCKRSSPKYSKTYWAVGESVPRTTSSLSEATR